MSLDWVNEELDRLRRDALLRSRRTVTPLERGWCEIDGRRLLNFATNDYLGLSGHRRVQEAAECAVDEVGIGARSSALVAGRTEWHDRLERRIAQFENCDAAILFPSGYAANVGTITSLVGAGDVVFCDRLNHASLVDGCRLSRARMRVYPHGDVTALDRDMSQFDRTEGKRLIVSDALFSMDGDAAPLKDLCEIAERHQAMLLIDEAHATGVLGSHGRGLVEEEGLEQRPIIRVGTLSKAIGAQGGFVTGSRPLIDWLFNTARTQMFSTALSPAACAAACAALDLIQEEPERRMRLRQLSTLLRREFLEAGLAIGHSQVGPMIPVILGDAEQTMEVSRRLYDQGFLVAAIRPPTVPAGTSRLRISVMASHSEEDLRLLSEALVRSVSAC